MKWEISWHLVGKGNDHLRVAYHQKHFEKMAKDKHLVTILKDKNLSLESKAVIITIFAKEGNLEAMCLLGKILYDLKHYEEAVKWLHIASLNRVLDQDARFILATMHMNGEHFPLDYQEAKKLYQENALLGHPPSQFMMDNSSFGENNKTATMPWGHMKAFMRAYWRRVTTEEFLLCNIFLFCVTQLSFVDYWTAYVLGLFWVLIILLLLEESR